VTIAPQSPRKSPARTDVVLVPGLGLRAESWAPTVQALHEAGVVDPARTTTALLRGYGRPALRGDPLTPADLASHLLDQVGSGPVVLMALSAGCQVAAHAALQAPDRVTALVLVGPTTDPRGDTWPRLVRRWLATARHESPRQVPALVRQYRRTGLRSMARAMDAARSDRIEAVLPLLGCPVLLLRGQHDAIAPPDWLGLLAGGTDPAASGATPHRHRGTVAGGAHMVPWTHGAAVARLVADFLGQGVC
jgi:pimeloyl-ACP methyl ester carboxylesterase